MKLVTYTHAGRGSIGKVLDGHVIDLAGAMPTSASAPTLVDVLRGGAALRERLQAVQPHEAERYALSAVQLHAPIGKPEKFLAIGLNYRDHVEEILRRGGKAPEHQMWFNKNVSCITGPYDPVWRPRVSQALDYEGELGVVIGQRCKHVPVQDAMAMVGGYLVLNDVTCRDWQRKTTQWTLGKSFDTHGPMGPWLVTPDEVPDVQQLEMRLQVNGELRQRARIGNMVYGIAEQIAYLSSVMTLEPGDVLATGTCSGAGFGFDPPRFLQPGDVVRVEIDGLGHIENRIVEEPV